MIGWEYGFEDAYGVTLGLRAGDLMAAVMQATIDGITTTTWGVRRVSTESIVVPDTVCESIAEGRKLCEEKIKQIIGHLN